MGLLPSERGAAGLAFLLSQPGAGVMGLQPSPPSSTLLSHVYDIPDPQLCTNDEDIDYQQLDATIQQHVAGVADVCGSAEAGQASSSANVSAQPPPGRVGPKDVAIDQASVCGSFSYSTDSLTIESLANFSSCRANVAVFKGKWMYECTVLTPGIQQVGYPAYCSVFWVCTPAGIDALMHACSGIPAKGSVV